MRTLWNQIWLGWAFLMTLLATGIQGFSAPTRPNLVLIIADDMAWNDCGAYGNAGIQTPNLDRMAANGMRFDSAFLTCSSCSPSRCSTITGRYPHATGAFRLHEPLPPTQVTFVEKLRQAGYWTAAAGKWHLGNATLPKFDLVKQGGGPSGCENWIPTLQQCPKDRPFFLWLASSDPHRGYKDGILPVPHQPGDVTVPPFLPDQEATRKDLAQYYDEITRLDGFVGQVLDELKTQGVDQQTLVLFISDNGRPFPRCKTTVYDSGIKTPWIVQWPGTVPPGTASAQLVSSVDIAPTFLKLAGLQAGRTFQGRDFSPILTDPDRPIRRYIYAEHNWHDFDDHGRAVRDLRYKYVRNEYTDIPGTPPADAVRSPTFELMLKLQKQDLLGPNQKGCFQAPRPAEELYDTWRDPDELENLADDPNHALILQRLRGEWKRWSIETEDSVPDQRTPDGFDRITGEKLPNKTLSAIRP